MTQANLGDVLTTLHAIADGADDAIPLDNIQAISDEHKPGGAEYDQIASELEALAENGPAARSLITRYLHKTKLGYKATREEPIMASGVLRWLVERVANLLDAEPSFRLEVGPGEFEPDGAPSTVASLNALEALDFTSALRKLHRSSVIAGQVGLGVKRMSVKASPPPAEPAQESKWVATLGPGDFFGEASLLPERENTSGRKPGQANATIVCFSYCEFLKIGRAHG